jgi:hypothetical protein
MKKMTPEDFNASMTSHEPPGYFSTQQKALWFAGKGEWEKAHRMIQDFNDSVSCHIHAFLHRQEGDLSNTGYWYQKAGKKMPDISLDREWEDLVSTLAE